MLQAYLDRAQKSDDADGVMCVVATVFKPIRYKQFVRPWNRMLKRWQASAFHATDFYPGGGEFDRKTARRKEMFDSDSREIPAMIGKAVSRVVTIAFRPSEFMAEIPIPLKENFGTDMHSIAAQLCLVINGWWLEDKRSSERFVYFQESGDPSEGKIAEAVRILRNDRDYGPAIRVQSFSTVDKGIARGLEASDFVAWHWNKYYMDKFRTGLKPRKDFAAFAQMTQAKHKVATAFITGEKLRLFFDTLEKARHDKLQYNANAKGKAAQ